jgi:hypothetical protein
MMQPGSKEGGFNLEEPGTMQQQQQRVMTRESQ